MKIGVIGASGKVGSLILKEAIKRGHDVTAIVRNKNKVNIDKVIEKDIMSLNKSDLDKFDVVVCAVGYWTPETLHLHTDGLVHLAVLLKSTNVRLIVVGGAGSLYVNDEHSVQLFDTPNFPEAYKPVSGAMRESLARLRNFSDVAWTYISPADEFDPEGKYTGEYILGGEEYFVNAEGKSYISYADYANALVDEIENAKYLRRRISVVEK